MGGPSAGSVERCRKPDRVGHVFQMPRQRVIIDPCYKNIKPRLVSNCRFRVFFMVRLAFTAKDAEAARI
jgi:hypothetical protein